MFFDTNVFLYTLEAVETRKRDVAVALVRTALESGLGSTSTQVLNEFYSNAVGKYRIPRPEARRHVHAFGRLAVVPLDGTLVAAAVDYHQIAQISYWDALIVRAAVASRSTILYSEDLAPGQVYEGVRVVNPFAA